MYDITRDVDGDDADDNWYFDDDGDDDDDDDDDNVVHKSEICGPEENYGWLHGKDTRTLNIPVGPRIFLSLLIIVDKEYNCFGETCNYNLVSVIPTGTNIIIIIIIIAVFLTTFLDW